MEEQGDISCVQLSCVANYGASEAKKLPTRKAQPRIWFIQRYRTTRKCISSRSALLILLWSFLLGLWNGVAFNPDLYLQTFVNNVTLVGYGIIAVIFCFFPLAEFLADTRFGRYKTVVRSLFFILISIPLTFVVVLALLTIINIHVESRAVFLFLTVLLSLFAFALTILTYIGVVGFTANVIQFGMDQLHDSPGEDRTLFIHWYVWVYYLSIFIGQLAWNVGLLYPTDALFDIIFDNTIGVFLVMLIPPAVIVILAATLCLARHRRRWFLIEPGRLNPYRLVYRVTKFARQHKTPVNRSAFTYCEDEVPTGLDLGKEKYGGPFTTEEVEDVKVFYGILKVLFGFGTVFFLDFAATSVLPLYAFHTNPFYQNFGNVNGTGPSHVLLNNGLYSLLLIVVSIPAYLCLLRPFILYYVPGMLKRMWLGMVLTVLSLMASFSMDTAAHMKSRDIAVCMFDDEELLSGDLPEPVPLNPLFLFIQLTLSALSQILINTAVFEFICSQSPHSMKGLLIGLLYAIRGVYQGIATLLVVPFAVSSLDSVSPSCGFYYYLVNVVLGVIAVLAYMWVARRYRYRERDEPSNIHRYAEEYYSNPNQEQYYDYD